MKLNELYKIEIQDTKITDYLLNPTHPDGFSKARYFNKIGYNTLNSNLFKKELIKIADIREITKIIETAFGIKYIVDGEILSAGNKIEKIRTVWFVENIEKTVKLVTAYALKS